MANISARFPNSTSFKNEDFLIPKKIEKEMLATREWVKNNLPPSKFTKINPLNGLTREEYTEICNKS